MTNHTESYEASRGQYSKPWEDLEDAILLVTKYNVSPENAADDLKLSENTRKKLFEMKL